MQDWVFRLTPYLIFDILQFEILSLMNLIFGLFKIGILQATQAVNIKFKLDKKSSLFETGILQTSSADRYGVGLGLGQTFWADIF